MDLLDESFASGELSLGIASNVSSIVGHGVRRAFQSSPQEGLRNSLRRWLRGDATWAWNFEDDTFRRIHAMVDADVDVVIAGHTHLARAIPRGNGRVYFNAGTWMRLIRFDDAKLASAEAFEPIYAALTAGSLAALDSCPGLVLDRPTVVRVRPEKGRVRGGLYMCRLREGVIALEENELASAFVGRAP